MAALQDSLTAIAEVLAGPASDDAVGVSGANGTDITDTTPREILAAPASGKRFRITQIVAHNRTAAEVPIIIIEDGSAVELYRFNLGAGGAADSRVIVDLHPPILVAVDESVAGQATTATGDTVVTLRGFEETPV
jgi:hypothetical protein